MVLRITTWNVNGIRNPFGYQPWRDKRTFEGMFDALQSDIVVMQELKIQRKDLRDDMVLVPGWDCYFSLPKHKKGYSGVGIYTRQSVCAPIRAEEGVLGASQSPGSSFPYCDLPKDQHIGGYLSQEQIESLGVDAQALDAEGRCVVLEFPAFVLFGIYSPANSNGLRDDFRYGFLSALDTRIRNLIALGKRVVVTGDLNVSREEIDVPNAAETLRKEGMTHEQYISTPNRRIFNQLLEGGKVVGERDPGREESVMWDICRGFHLERAGMYTHWEQKINARPGNFGSRIDYVLCSLDMKSWFCESNIQEGLMGSDHCPVYAVIKEVFEIKGKKIHIKDIMNALGTFQDGQRLVEYNIKNVPAFSGKLLPEFDKRRSIRDMFGTKPSLKSMASSNNTSVADIDTLLGEDSFVDDDTLSRQSSQVTAAPTLMSTPSASASPARKRSAANALASRPVKRTKSATSAPTTAAAPKGQQSLKGFFRPKQPAQSAVKNDTVIDRQPEADDPAARSPRSDAQFPPVLAFQDSSQAEQDTPIYPAPDPPTPLDKARTVRETSQDFIDPFVAKESWSRLFVKPAVPRCEGHDEPCMMMKTKKKGFNNGRDFWMCARPLGPSGQKEKNSQWRCGTFIWSSDWNGGGERNKSIDGLNSV